MTFQDETCLCNQILIKYFPFQTFTTLPLFQSIVIINLQFQFIFSLNSDNMEKLRLSRQNPNQNLLKFSKNKISFSSQLEKNIKNIRQNNSEKKYVNNFKSNKMNSVDNQQKANPSKKTLKRTTSLRDYGQINEIKSQNKKIKQNQVLQKNNLFKSRERQTDHDKLNNKLLIIQRKVQQMKNDLIKKKQQKQKIIRDQMEERQRWHRQRYQKLYEQVINEKKQQQQKKKMNINKKSQSKPSLLEQKQNSILKNTVIQMPQPKQVQMLKQNPYSPRSDTYYVSQIAKTYKNQKSLAKQHIVQSLQIMRTLQNTKMPPYHQVQKRKLNLSQKKNYVNKKVLIFDLDQTLIHCNDSLSKSHDVKIGIKFPNGSIVEAGVNIRPYAKQILRNLHKDFQIIVFTASQACYADQVLNLLDPNKQYIQHRLYRQHCYLSPEAMYIKDLRIINRPLSNMILVDNAAYSYFFQLQNGIPIIPYYQGNIDYELKALQNYLLKLVLVRDVRIVNTQTFKLNRYIQYYNTPNKLVEDLYVNKG